MSDRTKTWLVAILCTLPLLGWWAYGLLDLDEGFYGAIAAEMLRKGQWITPLYNGHPWFEKPILIYWITIPFLKLFGAWFGPRVSSVLCCLGLYALIGWFAKRHFGKVAGWVAPLVLATSILFIATGRMLLTDPSLNLTFSAAMIFFVESLIGDRRYRVIAAFMLGVSFLSKGPVGGAFFLIIAGWTFYREKELRQQFKGLWLLSIAAFLIAVLSWYLPALLIDRQVFVQDFLIQQNVDRFAGGDAAHHIGGIARFIYFIPVILIGMAPWSFFLWRSYKKPAEPSGNIALIRRYLWTWALTVFAIFTISGSKLPTYVLPCFPPLAILIAADLSERWPEFTTKRLIGFAGGSVFLCAFANAGFIGYYDAFHAEVHADAFTINRLDPEHKLPVVIFQMSSENTPMDHQGLPDPMMFGVIPIHINETTHPSLLLYLNHDVIETGKLSTLLSTPTPCYVITRANRIGPAEEGAAASHSRGFIQIHPENSHFYALYEMEEVMTSSPPQKR